MTTALAGDMPVLRPANPCFSTGPTAKFPGHDVSMLDRAVLGRSHRSKPGKAKLLEVIERQKSVLGVPEDWRLGIIAGSDTGAFECAMWNLLGPRGVDALVWESFGKDWATDATKQLPLSDVRVLDADYGALPDLGAVDFDRDVLITWNGTTSGVRVPDGEWIPDDRAGLVMADATSAVFAMPIPWGKLDVVTWSWQKALGGEAQHGMLALGPRAVERIAGYAPAWPIPKIFRLRKGDGLNEGVFQGATLNTPSMLAVEDCLIALDWAESIGGLAALHARTDANFRVISDWIDRTDWADHLAIAPETRSPTSVCIKIVDPDFAALDASAQSAFQKRITGMLDKHGVAHDIDGYRDAPPSLRIWGGPTVETSDLEALTPWLDWAFARATAT